MGEQHLINQGRVEELAMALNDIRDGLARQGEGIQRVDGKVDKVHALLEVQIERSNRTDDRMRDLEQRYFDLRERVECDARKGSEAQADMALTLRREASELFANLHREQRQSQSEVTQKINTINARMMTALGGAAVLVFVIEWAMRFML